MVEGNEVIFYIFDSQQTILDAGRVSDYQFKIEAPRSSVYRLIFILLTRVRRFLLSIVLFFLRVCQVEIFPLYQLP